MRRCYIIVHIEKDINFSAVGYELTCQFIDDVENEFPNIKVTRVEVVK